MSTHRRHRRGLMGHGIAYLLAAAGHTVRIYDPSAEWRDLAAAAAGSRARAARRRPGAARAHHGARPDGRGDERRVRSCSRRRRRSLRSSSRSSPSSRASTAPTTILASNSSAIPSTEIGRQPQASRARGRHAFLESAASRAAGRGDPDRMDQRRDRAQDHRSPARRRPRAGARADATSRASSATGCNMRFKREAIALVAAGVCDAETIDTVVKSGFGARMAVLGPMEQSDLVGLDLTLDIQNVLIADLDNSTEPTAVPQGQGRVRQARHAHRRGLPALDPGAGRRGARAAAALSRRAGQGGEEVATPPPRPPVACSRAAAR